ncbi:hypothetical protein J2X45_001945 [Caulobacter sp. BE264]|uniref:DUF3800 domain-containing protein n=1 Tax=Caulobacter sp. BE264 TaxID=2817724 RepID=UPI002864C4B6|nr:DUF3800 domain-containing protein [Caulobacter sp. BE264]MDR7230854.1 hypothetical protein [Caulobacter sp. BE264]
MMYVDESGDIGLSRSPTRYFSLVGITVHESRWKDLHSRLVSFRRIMRDVHGLPVRTEVHASDYVRRAPVDGMPKHVRLAILRQYIDELAKIDFISITSVVVDKAGKPDTYDVFARAWQALFQRFENTIGYGNFPGRHRADKGMVFVDNTDGQKLQNMVRKMAVYNPVPNMHGGGYRDLPLLRVIEDPHPKDSATSYFIQSADVCAYFLHQKMNPCSYVRKIGAKNYYDRLRPVLNLRASLTSDLGIVAL